MAPGDRTPPPPSQPSSADSPDEQKPASAGDRTPADPASPPEDFPGEPEAGAHRPANGTPATPTLRKPTPRAPSEQKPEPHSSDRTPRAEGFPEGYPLAETDPAAGNGSPGKNGDSAARSNHQALVEYFVEHWRSRWGATYPFGGGGAGAKNGKHVKSILANCGGDLAHAKRCVDAFLRCSEPFFVDGKHGLGLLVSQLHKFISSGAGRRPQAQGPRIFREDN